MQHNARQQMNDVNGIQFYCHCHVGYWLTLPPNLQLTRQLRSTLCHCSFRFSFVRHVVVPLHKSICLIVMIDGYLDKLKPIRTLSFPITHAASPLAIVALTSFFSKWEFSKWFIWPILWSDRNLWLAHLISIGWLDMSMSHSHSLSHNPYPPYSFLCLGILCVPSRRKK